MKSILTGSGAGDGVCQLVEKHLASGHGAERL
jgi:hypothetical protein